MNKFCFVIHPLSLDDVARYEPGAKGKGQAIIHKIMEWMPSYAAVHVTGVRAPDGREIEGWFVAAPLLATQMLEFPREEVYERILRAIEIGAELGAQVAGLGAFSGVVGDAGITINARSPIPVTTGNSLTIAAGVQSLFRGARELGCDAAESTAVVIGATGSIGSACAQMIAPKVKHLVLVARNETRLRKFAEQTSFPCETSYTTDISAAVRRAHLVLTATTSTQDVIEPEDLQTGAVVCELSLPHDVSRRVAEERDDVLVMEGGNMLVPGEPRFERVREPGTEFDLNLPPRTALACMSETMVLALEGRFEPYTLGRGIELARVREIEMLAEALRLLTCHHARVRCGDHAGESCIDEGGRRIAPRQRVKKIISVSLGSSTRDHRARVTLMGEEYDISRVGTDGKLDAAIAMVRELDGNVDAIGLGGIDVYLYAGRHRYALRDGLRLLEAAKVTPVVDGSGLKNTLERKAVAFMQQELGIDLRGKHVLMVSALDRFGMAQALVDAGADVLFGDFIFALDKDMPVRGLHEFEELAEKYLPDACKLPFQFFYPTGKKQEKPPEPKYPQYYEEAEIIAGDFHFMRQFMPDRLDGKIVLTNTVTQANVDELAARGVRTLITTTPDIAGRSFGTNVIEAALLALLGKKWSDVTPADYDRALSELALRPRVVALRRSVAPQALGRVRVGTFRTPRASVRKDAPNSMGFLA